MSSQPRSWAEDCKSYRETRGSRAYASLNTSGEPSSSKTMTEAPKRYARTHKVPFLETTHKLYPYDDQNTADGRILDQTRGPPDVDSDRFDRHGWGDNSLLKEDGYAGIPHPHSKQPTRAGKAIPSPPVAADGRSDLFGVLQMTQAGSKDSWIGNQLIDPDKGKRAVGLPPDPRGRQDLFDVLHARRPGVPSDDSWMGNRLVDPSKGKGHPPGPEQRRGRADLGEVFTQGILREPAPRKFDLLRKGVDPLSDGWVGNLLINPNLGKLPPTSDVAAAQESLRGATFRAGSAGEAGGHSDFPRPHTKAVPPPCEDLVPGILNGTARGDDWGKLSKRMVSEPKGTTTLPRPDNLYAHMTYKPLSEVESSTFRRTLDDGRVTGRGKPAAVPGEGEPGKGSTMLHWNDKARVGMFVRKGGLAQEGRPAVLRTG